RRVRRAGMFSLQTWHESAQIWTKTGCARRSPGAGSPWIQDVAPASEGRGAPLCSTPALLGAGQDPRPGLPVRGAEAAGLEGAEHASGLVGRAADVERVDHRVLEPARRADDEQP